MTERLIDKLIATKALAMKYARETAYLDGTSLICELMDEQCISREMLANRLEWPTKKLCMVVDGSAGDGSLVDICDILFELDVQLRFTHGSLTRAEEDAGATLSPLDHKKE